MPVDNWRRNLIALCIAQMLTMVAFSFILPFIPLYVQALGIHGTTEAAQWAGMIGAAAAVSMSVAQPIWGNLSDRWGRRPMVIRSMVGGSITVTLMGFATSPDQLLALRFLQGAVAGTVAASNTLVATSTPKERLGFALGLMQVAMFTGTSIGPLVGGLIADTYGYRIAFYAAGTLMMTGALVVVTFCRERFTRPSSAVPRAGVFESSRSLLATATFPILVSVIFLIQLGGVIVSPVLSLFIAELSGQENAATSAGLVLAAAGTVSAASALAIGRVSDRLGHRTILPLCLVGAAVTYFPQALVQQVWQLLLLRVLLGVCLGGLMPAANALVANTVSAERRGAAFGLTATANGLANAVGPLSGAAIATHFGMRAVFLATGVLFAIGFGWATLGFRRAEEPRPSPRDSVA